MECPSCRRVPKFNQMPLAHWPRSETSSGEPAGQTNNRTDKQADRQTDWRWCVLVSG